MLKIFIGLAMLFLYINISGVIFTFDFIGYIIIFLGLKQLSSNIKSFEKGKSVVLCMVTFSILTQIVSYFDLFNTLPLTVIEEVGRLAVTYFIIMGYEELERKLDLNLCFFRLNFLFKLQVATCGIYFLCVFVNSITLAALFNILSLVISFISLFNFYKAYKVYRYSNR